MPNKQIILTIHNASEAIYYLEQEKEKRTKIFWTMKNGDKIDITEMSDTNLTNTIELLKKTNTT